MSAPKLARILALIAARVETITTANGYQTEIGQAVTDWPLSLEEPDAYGVAVYLTERVSEEKASSTQRMTTEVVVEAHHRHVDGLSRAELAAWLLADIQRAVETAQSDGLAALLMDRPHVPQLVSESIDYSDPAGEVVSVRVIYSVPHNRKRADPEIA